MKTKALGTAIFLLNFGLSASAESPSYLCISDTIGLYAGSEGDRYFDFSSSNDKFIVKMEADTKRFEVTNFGSADSLFSGCELYLWTIRCGDLNDNFVMNLHTMRFQKIFGVGYLFVMPADMTPQITVGRCNKI
jgi:hypothetical protein